MKLKQIMSSDVESISPDTTVSQAAEIMRISDVGCLPVVDEAVVGVLTDRDIVVRVIGKDLDPRVTVVADVMTPGAHTLNQDADVCEAVSLMRNSRVRRVPVVNDTGRLVGMISLTDVALRAHEPIQSGSALLSICGRPAPVG